MANLLTAVTVDTVGTAVKVAGPTTIFVESTNLGSGTITLYASRTATSRKVSLGTYTAETVQNDTIVGLHYLWATLSGSSGAAATTVSLVGTGL